jgi:hypothetical protein
MTDDELAELERIARAALAGETLGDKYEPDPSRFEWPYVPTVADEWGRVCCEPWNADTFAAHVKAFDPTTVLALLAEIRRLRSVLPRALELVEDEWTGPGDEDLTYDKFIGTLRAAIAGTDQP